MITIGKGEFNSQKYVCAGNRWYPLQAPEDSLGLCTNNGEKGTYRGQEFICNTSEHIWYHHFTDSRDNREYRSVLLRGMLVMAENVKYGGDSMYVWHEAMALDESCDSLYCAEADFDTSGHQGICPTDGSSSPLLKQVTCSISTPFRAYIRHRLPMTTTTRHSQGMGGQGPLATTGPD